MRKFQLDFSITENKTVGPGYSLIQLVRKDGEPMPETKPGQFVEILAENAKDTLLRRPISISFADRNKLWLLVRRAGNATDSICNMPVGADLDIILPLGNGFSTDGMGGKRVLLVGGGVGIAPLWMLSHRLKGIGADVCTLAGARTESLLLLRKELSEIGKLVISTDDGSCGEKGVITENSIWNSHWDMVYVCGPVPMMKAVAALCRERKLPCEVSLENMMACGLGACLCCVEKTVNGNQCVCTDGPVFNINQLLW